MKHESKMEAVVASPLQQRIEWQPTGNPLAPWKSCVAGETWTVRINDFPEEHLYTVFRDGVVLEDFDDWPSHWIRNRERKARRDVVAAPPRTATKTRKRR
jgi:hypothetical protein